jgi:multicomponent Na+:H+ antiporter subunit C
MSAIVLYVTFILLLTIGIIALLFKRNLIKIVLAFNIMDSGINAMAPIFTPAPLDSVITMVLPTPQALILTNIVIGFATTALMLGVSVLTYRNNNTLDTRKLRGVEEYD